MPLRALFSALQYSSPAELFSCWACLYQDEDVRKVPNQLVRTHAPAFRQAISDYRAQRGMLPHPATLVQWYRGARGKQRLQDNPLDLALPYLNLSPCQAQLLAHTCMESVW